MAQDEKESAARRLWDMSHRGAMQIAWMPRQLRNDGYEATEEAFRDTAGLLEIEPDDVDQFVSLHVQLIRDMVARIELSGMPVGGHA